MSDLPPAKSRPLAGRRLTIADLGLPAPATPAPPADPPAIEALQPPPRPAGPSSHRHSDQVGNPGHGPGPEPPPPPPPVDPPALSPPRALIEALRARWPEAFTLPKRPLVIGIHKQILAAWGEGGCDPAALSWALHLWVRGLAYQLALLRQPHRVDLDGKPAGEVSAEHRERARVAVAALHAARKAREAAGKRLA